MAGLVDLDLVRVDLKELKLSDKVEVQVTGMAEVEGVGIAEMDMTDNSGLMEGDII